MESLEAINHVTALPAGVRTNAAIDPRRHRHTPLIVGIGGTTRDGSTTERALALTLRAAAQLGARTVQFGGAFLAGLPHYSAEAPRLTADQIQFVETVRSADALIVATPGYHGGVSGLVKNALDTLEALNNDTRPYLEGRAVGCIVTAYGAQTGGTVLASLRAVVHALRGWPTPFGATINTQETRLDEGSLDARVMGQLMLIADQAIAFARTFAS